ncbi:hypothetical protein DUNSADRAFT_18140 [Dunaliella salina]|uniref:Uncharacterized protein n=1 Tax=Dunaliella salina TaxID=3046 RepID=A0ABQ7GZE3_DUNSA|nr:hypothetical protein DUNSADRAFT_18140 [Dunaliella salina]|eukprot:KAF5839980.1 hypothetical protein DUNSADRAFT_18140 [Dunaliella salina]
MTTKDFFTRDCTEVTPRECGGYQLGYQIAGICVALGISILWGLIVGTIITYCNIFREQDLSAAECFDDGPWWQEQAVEPMDDIAHPAHHQHASTVHSEKLPLHAADKQGARKQHGHVEVALDASYPTGDASQHKRETEDA